MGVKMNHFVHFFRFFILCSGKVIEGVKMNYFVNFVLPLMAKSSIKLPVRASIKLPVRASI